MKRRFRVAVLLAVALALPRCATLPPAETPPPGATDAERGAFARANLVDRGGRGVGPLAYWRAERNVPAVSVAVVHEGRVVWTWAGGRARADERTQVTPDFRFQAASISKPVTALRVLQLARDGTLDLSAPVNDYLTTWQVPRHRWQDAAPVTAALLLQHRAGTTVGGFPGYVPGARLPTLRETLDGAGNANHDAVVVQRKPGLRTDYSGGGTQVLQALIEDLDRQPFAESLAVHVLQPLGMESSAFDQPRERARGRAAAGHDEAGEVLEGFVRVYPELAAAGLWSTAPDLARLLAGLFAARRGAAGGLLPPELVQAMYTPPEDAGPYGLGFQRDGAWFYHRGNNAGFRALLVGHTERDQGVVIMTNGAGGRPLTEEIARAVANAWGWQPLPFR